LTTVKLRLTHDTERGLSHSFDTLSTAANALEAVRAARQLREEAEALELEAVIDARGQRATWSEIGAVYGTSKQGAQQRFGAALRAQDPNH
jgi:hypothetical protein